MDNQQENLNDVVVQIVKDYLQSQAFQDKKITDTPTDGLSTVNRNYVNKSGTTSNRPTNSVFGQRYLDTTIGRPIYLNTNGKWIDGAGSVS